MLEDDAPLPVWQQQSLSDQEFTVLLDLAVREAVGTVEEQAALTALVMEYRDISGRGRTSTNPW